ncbi:HpcH/HpaI aldolase [Magnetococcus marinus MC-1]|uniref:HpcH/HpaI aldolase n=1 Tax=Magnetococcus marinus (strain ATCC BAA-1437 / JCM 17883 / MC-1) TaxID=156889 RepID=A0L6U8_MAGMM|nr:aldolase/citrate lyase family protein [Magnetococcus marinus]ABK43691.1 HpcH/HpaI aldolase [Magnetococcus marinus MC-1]
MSVVRSIMMVAGDKPRHLEKIPQLVADWAMVNLEDGVGDKQAARQLVAETLGAMDPAVVAERVVIRINPMERGGMKDLRALSHLRPRAFRLPKVEDQETLHMALGMMDEAVELHFTVETRAAWNMLERFKIDNRVTTAYLGILDLMADLGIPQSLLKPDNPTIDYILAHFLIQCRSIDLLPVSFVYQDHRNLAELERWCEKVKAMGYTAKGCIAPAQAEVINRCFAPDPAALARAQAIISRFAAQREQGVTGFVDPDYGFIDEPIVRDAQRLLQMSPREPSHADD